MPVSSIDDEAQQNQQRQAENEARDDDDGSIVDGFEKAINPVVENFDTDGDDAPDEEDIARQRRLNDEAQRPE